MKLYEITYSHSRNKKDIFGDRKFVTKVGTDIVFSNRTRKGIISEYNKIKGYQNRKVTNVRHIKPRKL